jgi:hypothetical protein
MPYSVIGYKERAKECVKLANLANDELVRRELLTLRQTYLNIAERLRRQGFESGLPRDPVVASFELRRDEK